MKDLQISFRKFLDSNNLLLEEEVKLEEFYFDTVLRFLHLY